MLEVAFGCLCDRSAVQEADRELGASGGAEALGEAEGGLVLIELSGSDVPGPGRFAAGGSGAEGVGDAFGGVSADLAGADAAVVAEAAVDVVELGLHGRASLVELACLGEALFEVGDAALDRVDLVGSFADRSGQVLDGSLGVGDVEFVASASEGPVVFGEGVEGSLESVAGLVERGDGRSALVLGPAADLAGARRGRRVAG